nr:MAG TPA: hypothetical protein [Caudoviricetes sp.]
MGCPENSYERMCREVDRIMSDKPNTNFDISFDEVLNRVKAYEHNPNFYYNSGIAARNVFCDIAENEGNDALNAACGGLYMFEELILLHKEDEDI